MKIALIFPGNLSSYFLTMKNFITFSDKYDIHICYRGYM